MISIDASALIALLLAAALGGVLIGILPAWRRLMEGGPDLPLWGFLRRRGIALETFPVLQAELRCELCGSKPQCKRLLAEGGDAPPAHCPNAELFAAPREAASGTKVSPTG